MIKDVSLRSTRSPSLCCFCTHSSSSSSCAPIPLPSDPSLFCLPASSQQGEHSEPFDAFFGAFGHFLGPLTTWFRSFGVSGFRLLGGMRKQACVVGCRDVGVDESGGGGVREGVGELQVGWFVLSVAAFKGSRVREFCVR